MDSFGKVRALQENSFKCLSENYGVAQLIQYGADYHEDERLVDSPKRALLKQKIVQVQEDIVLKEAELGQALEINDEKVHRTARGLKVAHAKLRWETGDLYARLARLEARLAKTPAKVGLNQIKDKAMVAIHRTDRRNMVNAIKLAAYNGERLPARKFFRHYRDLRDWLTIFRSLFHLSGTITCGDDRVLVELEAPDRPHIRQALEATIQELNPVERRLFGTGPRLVYALKRQTRTGSFGFATNRVPRICQRCSRIGFPPGEFLVAICRVICAPFAGIWSALSLQSC